MSTDNFARRLLLAYRGTPEETINFWDEMDAPAADDYDRLVGRQPLSRDGGRSGYRAATRAVDQDDDEERRWR